MKMKLKDIIENLLFIKFIKINKIITIENLLEKIKIKFLDINIFERHLLRIVKNNNVSKNYTI